jgi:hypothetical protein
MDRCSHTPDPDHLAIEAKGLGGFLMSFDGTHGKPVIRTTLVCRDAIDLERGGIQRGTRRVQNLEIRRNIGANRMNGLMLQDGTTPETVLARIIHEDMVRIA